MERSLDNKSEGYNGWKKRYIIRIFGNKVFLTTVFRQVDLCEYMYCFVVIMMEKVKYWSIFYFTL